MIRDTQLSSAHSHWEGTVAAEGVDATRRFCVQLRLLGSFSA